MEGPPRVTTQSAVPFHLQILLLSSPEELGAAVMEMISPARATNHHFLFTDPAQAIN
jgi:hypothetical protein